MSRERDYLPDNTMLENFQITKVLGGGGFSIVYLGKNLATFETVVIKEYFPSKLAKRDDQMNVIPLDEKSERYFRQGRKLFFQETSILACINHKNVVDVIGFASAYDTIYMVMRYERGISLQSYIKRQGKGRSEKFILSVFKPILNGLNAVHELGLMHLDIKPGNIYLRQNASPLLLDFGATHKIMLSADTRMFPVVSHGFSPPEQSRRNGELGPWSDLYAIGASMRSCIDAKPPPPAKDRIKKNSMTPAKVAFKDQYSVQLLEAIDWAMEMDVKDRPQSVSEFLQQLPTT